MGISAREQYELYLSGWEDTLDPQKVDTRRFLRSFKIEGVGGQQVFFDLNVIQERLHEEIERCEREGRPVRIIILKARQEGCSTYADGRLLDKVVRVPGQKCLIIADDEDNTAELYQSKVLELWEQIPEEVRPEEIRSNRMELAIRHGTSRRDKKRAKKKAGFRRGARSYVRVMTAGKKEGGRSRTIQHVHFSEAAFYRNAETVFDATLQAVHDVPGTSVIIESTANGAAGVYYDYWQDAVAGRNEYLALFFPWWDFPSYTRPFESEEEKAAFARSMNELEQEIQEKYKLSLERMNWWRFTLWNKCRGDKIRMFVEYPSCPEDAFIHSGTCRFDLEALRSIEKKKCPKPIARGRVVRRRGEWTFEEDNLGMVVLYRKPVPGREYMVSADTGLGIGSAVDHATGGEKGSARERSRRNPSVFNVYDRRSRQLMARFSEVIDPTDFATPLWRVGMWFNEALLAVERNQGGITTLRRLQKMEYPRLYVETKVDSATGKQVDRLGYWTGSQSRDDGINCLATEIVHERIELCEEQIAECRNFQKNDAGKWEAREGATDDEVTALWVFSGINVGTRYEPYVPEPEPEPEVTRIEEWEMRHLAEMQAGEGTVDTTLGSEW